MPAKKKSAAIRKRDAIFVNAYPSDDNERADLHRKVRQHVGRWISDQTKDREDPSNPLPSGLNLLDRKPLDSSPQPKHPPSDHDLDESLLTSSSSPASADPSSPLSAGSSSTNSVCATLLGTPHAQEYHQPPAHDQNGDQPRTASPFSSNTSTVVLESNGLQSVDSTSEVSHDPRDSEALVALETVDSSSTSSFPSLIPMLGISFLDPFDTHPASSLYPRDFVDSSEKYCLTTLWPGLTPGSTSINDVSASQWLPISLQEPTVFQAFLFGSLSHKRAQWVNGRIHDFTPRDQHMLQMAEIETIKLINREVHNPSRALCDATLMSVMCMAHNVADSDYKRRYQRTPFCAPLEWLQWMDVYGSLKPNIIHVQGLVQMVELRGGLQNIGIPGLGAVLSFSDLMTSSSFLRPPTFMYMALGPNRQDLSLQDMLDYTPVDVEQRFGHLRPIGCTSDMIDTFCAMHRYMAFVDDYLRTNPMKPDHAKLSDQRNLVQYTLLSLPSADSRPDLEFRSPNHATVYEATRLAALAYGVGVVFPLPAQSSPLPELARRIKTLLQSSDIDAVWSHSQAAVVALLWILTLGGIAAQDRPEREWYVRMLRHVAFRNHVTNWSDLHGVLRLMLWHELSCDRPAVRLWNEVDSLMAYRTYVWP